MTVLTKKRLRNIMWDSGTPLTKLTSRNKYYLTQIKSTQGSKLFFPIKANNASSMAL